MENTFLLLVLVLGIVHHNGWLGASTLYTQCAKTVATSKGSDRTDQQCYFRCDRRSLKHEPELFMAEYTQLQLTSQVIRPLPHNRAPLKLLSLMD